jgi:hypothetical protein
MSTFDTSHIFLKLGRSSAQEQWYLTHPRLTTIAIIQTAAKALTETQEYIYEQGTARITSKKRMATKLNKVRLA